MPTILITGVSTGIGRACAELYASRGWDVVGTVRDPGRSAIEWPGPGRVSLRALELSERGSGARLAEEVIADEGCPDIVLCNAGVLEFSPAETVAYERIEEVFRINVFEQVALARAFVPAMRERGSGTLAFVTSLGGRMTFPFFSVYNASKHALEGFAEGMWHELYEQGIRVKAIEPGFVETAIWGKALPGDPDAVDAGAVYSGPMRSMLGLEASITDRTTPAAAAAEIARALDDGSDRLRYPVAAYARPILAARRVLGDRFMMRFFHRRWLGRD